MKPIQNSCSNPPPSSVSVIQITPRKWWVTCRFSYAMHHNDANKMTPHPPCHMRHLQNFRKIASFLKPVLDICILENWIVRWVEWVIKEVAGILHQIYRLMKVLIFGKVLKIFHLEKKTCNIYAHMFEFTFPREDVID